MIATFTLVLFVSFILLAYYLGRKPKNYPPGPRSLPIVGNLFQLSPEPYKDYMQFKKKYGDIFSIDLGSMKSVILTDYKLIKEAYSQINLSGRPTPPNFLEPGTGLAKGIIFSQGKHWMEQRKFILKTLRDFGFGTKSIESLVHDEVKELIESLRKEVNKPIYINDRFNIAVFNALWTIVAGERYSHSETKIQSLVHHISANMQGTKYFSPFRCFPWLCKLMPEYSGMNESMRHNIHIHNFMREVISAHNSTFQSGSNRDVIDCYLEHMKQTIDTESSFSEKEGESHLVMTLYDLFLGGTETTAYTLIWMFLVLARHPDIQEKVHEEIKNVVGDSRLPSLSDKSNLPYLEAVILELLRFSALFTGTFRKAVEDVDLRGYSIPKGTALFANLYGVNHDPEIWGDPENFRPERFLNEDRTKAVKHDALMPFGTGRRFCVGESLAKDQIFLFTASLFQRFKVRLGPNESAGEVKTIVGAPLRYPLPQTFVVQDRYSH